MTTTTIPGGSGTNVETKKKTERQIRMKKEEHHPGEKERGRGAVFVGVFSEEVRQVRIEKGAVEVANQEPFAYRFDQRTRRQNCKRRT